MSDTSEANPLLIDMRPRILFVDDSHVVRSAAVQMLGDDFDLALAEDGQEAWDMIVADKTIKLVFTDLVMPELDGFEVLNLVRNSTDERIRKLPIIVLTAADDSSGSKEKAYQLGATDFITKPFDAARIKAGAESHLSHLNTLSTTGETFETSNQDPLTGLLTSRAIHSQIEKDVSFTSQHNLHLAALHVEIDAFKELFVRIGRKRAELIIEKVAKAITDNTRKEDSVSRLGLASFAVSLPASDPDTTLLTAQRISLTVAGFKAKFHGIQLPVSVSIGVCITEQGAQSDADRILEIASEARRQATANGTGEVSSINLNADEEDNQPGQDEISVDHMLNQLNEGGKKDVVAQMDSILDKLMPLYELLSDDQREKLLVSLIEGKNAQS